MAERILVIDDEPNMLRLLKTILMERLVIRSHYQQSVRGQSSFRNL